VPLDLVNLGRGDRAGDRAFDQPLDVAGREVGGEALVVKL